MVEIEASANAFSFEGFINKVEIYPNKGIIQNIFNNNSILLNLKLRQLEADDFLDKLKICW